LPYTFSISSLPSRERYEFAHSSKRIIWTHQITDEVSFKVGRDESTDAQVKAFLLMLNLYVARFE